MKRFVHHFACQITSSKVSITAKAKCLLILGNTTSISKG